MTVPPISLAWAAPLSTALTKEPGILGDRFERVWLWHEWPDHDGPDTGIDLVAEERDGGLCAIQCKFFDPHRPVPKGAIDSFLAKSEPPQYTSRLIINTGGAIQRNALKTLQASPKPCRVLDAAELNGWDVDWLCFVDDPEKLEFEEREPYTPHPYQQEAVDKVCRGFDTHDRGQLILPCGTGKTAVTLWITEQMTANRGRGEFCTWYRPLPSWPRPCGSGAPRRVVPSVMWVFVPTRGWVAPMKMPRYWNWTIR